MAAERIFLLNKGAASSNPNVEVISVEEFLVWWAYGPRVGQWSSPRAIVVPFRTFSLPVLFNQPQIGRRTDLRPSANRIHPEKETP